MSGDTVSATVVTGDSSLTVHSNGSEMYEYRAVGGDTMRRIEEMRADQQLIDLRFVADDVVVPCHRVIVAAASPYFRALLQHQPHAPDASNATGVVTIPLFTDGSTVKAIVDFIYTGRVLVSPENVVALLDYGAMSQLDALVDICERFLDRHLHYTNCLGVWRVADAHGLSRLAAGAHALIERDFADVTLRGPEWCALDAELVQRFVSSDAVDVSNEAEIWAGIERWTDADRPQRTVHLPQLLSLLRWGSLDATAIDEIILRYPPVAESAELRALVAASRHGRRPSRPLGIGPPSIGGSGDEVGVAGGKMTTARPATLARPCLVMVSGATRDVVAFDTVRRRWRQLPSLATAVMWSAVVVCRNNVYVLGGVVNNTAVANVWVFETATRAWKEAAPMRASRAHHAAAVVADRYIVVVGGIRYEGDPRAVEDIDLLDVETGAWQRAGICACPRKDSKLAALQPDRPPVGGGGGSSSATARMETLLLEAGGTQADAQTPVIEIYQVHVEPSSPRVSVHVEFIEQLVLPPYGASRGQSLCYCQLLVWRSTIFILQEDTRRFCMLHFARRRRIDLAPATFEHIRGGACLIDGAIYVCGGFPLTTSPDAAPVGDVVRRLERFPIAGLLPDDGVLGGTGGGGSGGGSGAVPTAAAVAAGRWEVEEAQLPIEHATHHCVAVEMV